MNDYPTTLRVIAAFKAGEDLAERLESAVKAQNAMADALRNAADEIERLRLTDAEREAVQWFANFGRPQNGPVIGKYAATLRQLLERMK